MKRSDIFAMALRNLKGRRSRTKLTVMGVVIGTCAIVIMISIGVGINNTVTQQYQNSASATRISVYKNAAAADDPNVKQPPLDDRAVEYIESIEHVKTVMPVVNMTEYAKITRGRYSYTGGSITAVDFDQFADLGITASGSEIIPSADTYTVYFGDRAVVNFTDSNGNSVKYDSDADGKITDCEIKPLSDSFSISPSGGDSADGQSSSSVQPQRIRVAGVIDSPGSSGMDTSNTIFMDMKAAQKLLREYNALNAKPNTPPEYSEIYVYADDVKYVTAVQQAIGASGLATYSNEDDINSTKRTMAAVQLVLGAIGAVSMLVAAFGISNTMIMAVYERTKEIGVMKVIGCDIADIKAVFLCEAGMIGLIGGVIGVVISMIVSFIANLAADAVIGSLAGDASADITVSSVPVWLVLLGIGFSVIIGIVSGISPANRAVKVSALKAIHNE